MKKNYIILFIGLFGFNSFVVAQTKPTSKQNALKSSVTQQSAALVQALIDTINAVNQKGLPKKIIYGSVSLNQKNIVVYGPDGKQLQNPLLDGDLDKVQKSTSQNKNKIQYGFIQVDSVQFKLKRNVISWIRVWAPQGNFDQYNVPFDPLHFNDTIKVIAHIGDAVGYIKITDLISFAWDDTSPDDNFRSDIFLLTRTTSPKASITSY